MTQRALLPATLMLLFGVLFQLSAPAAAVADTLEPPGGYAALCYLAADNDASSDSGDVLVKLTASNEEVVLGPTGTAHMEAIAFQASSGRLFASSGRRLGTVDLNTGVFSPIGKFGGGEGALGWQTFEDIDGLTFDPFSGTLFASVRLPGADLLIKVDPETGAAIENGFGPGKTYVPVEPFWVEELELDDVDDIAVSSYDGMLYGILNEGGRKSRLVLIDKWTGDVTDLTDLDIENVEGLGFAADGTFLGVAGDSDRQVVVIDPDTGVTTLRKQLGVGYNEDYEAIACLTDLTNTISGTVFEDLNENQSQDYGESGAAGIIVALYRDKNGNGKVDSQDAFVAKKATKYDGTYEFEVSSIGDFVIETDLDSYPDGSTLTTDNLETASFQQFGQSDDGNDFGFLSGGNLADLSLTKSVSNSSPKKHEEVTFTITVRNDGPADATGIEVKDRLPYDLEFVSAWASKGQYDKKSGIWWIGDLDVGQATTLELTVEVLSLDMIENKAEIVAADQEDPDSTPGNGVKSEDDFDTAVVTARQGGGGFTPADCTDMATINALVYDEHSHQLFAGTETGVVHISNDKGNSWPPFLITENSSPIRDIVVSDDGVIYALTFGEGAFVSGDSGDTWTPIGLPDGKFQDGDLLDYRGLLYAADFGGVREWNGWDWQLVGAYTNPFRDEQVEAIAVDDQSGVIYATAKGLGMYAYSAGKWLPLGDGLPNGLINTIFADGTGTVYAGTARDGVYRLEYGSWKSFGWGLENESIETIALGPNGELLVGTTNRGAWYYDSYQGEWIEARNLPAFTVSAVTAGKDGEIYAGTAGQGVFTFIDSDKDGRLDQWRQIAALVANAVIQDLVKAPNGDLFAASYGYGVLYSNDGGQCWIRMNRGLENLWTYAIEMNSQGDLFLGIWADGLGGVWRSTDNARNWEYLDLGNRQILSIAIDPNNEDIIYAGANLEWSSIFRSMDGGYTWEALDSFGHPAWALAVNPRNSNNIVVGTVGAGIWESWDAGESFQLIGDPASGPSGAWDLAFAPKDTPYYGELFAATPQGVWWYDDWVPFGTGSESFDVRTIAFMGDMIFGGTWGKGVIAYNPYSQQWDDAGFGTLPVIAFATIPETGTLIIGTSGGGVFLGRDLIPTVATGTEDILDPVVPMGHTLGAAYPNPFNPQTTIPFAVEQSGNVRIAVYDLVGREAAVLLDGPVPSGEHSIQFDAGAMPSGTYLIRMQTEDTVATQTITLVK